GARNFRKATIKLVEKRWIPLTLTTVLSHLALFFVLLLSLRYLGVHEHEISWAQALAVFAFARLLSTLPFTPGGLGVVELSLIGLGLLAVLSFSPWGDALYRQLGGLWWWARALAFTGITLGLAFVLRLPLSYWRGYVHEKQWEFSTQSVRGWAIDRLKGLAVG